MEHHRRKAKQDRAGALIPVKLDVRIPLHRDNFTERNIRELSDSVHYRAIL